MSISLRMSRDLGRRIYMSAAALSLSVALLGATLLAATDTAESKSRQCRGAWTTWTNCVGTHRFPDGAVYVGQWRNGRPHGQGENTAPNGNKYVGGWRHGLRHGKGTYTWPRAGEKYVGEVRDDKLNGQGTYTWASGAKYVGEFRNGTWHGQGTYIWPDGEKYVGEWRDGKFNGQGIYTWPNGNKYVGEFRDGSKSGQGTYTYSNGDKYIGGWRAGLRHGEGRYTSANGSVIAGIWSGGTPVETAAVSEPTTTTSASSGTTEVGLVSDRGTFKVPVVINGVLPLHFTLDSGAADVSIPADVVGTLSRTGTLSESDFLGERQYVLADGSVVTSRIFRIRSLKVGDRVIENVVGSEAHERGSLLLGQSFLKNFSSWSIDNSRQVLVLD